MKLSVFGFAGALVLVGCAHAPAASTAPEDASSTAPSPTAATPDTPPLAEVKSNPMLDQAMQLYAARDYVGAAQAFSAAYAFEDSPSLLLAQAQALRLAGDCEGALPLYERFLETQTDPTYTNAVRPMMEACLDDGDPAVARAR